jgi:hypothetical protein
VSGDGDGDWGLPVPVPVPGHVPGAGHRFESPVRCLRYKNRSCFAGIA